MIRLTAEQAQQIEEALEDIVRVFKFETGTPVEALASIRAARAQEQAEPKCNPHPDAPHGFDRNASHSANRYVCECEGWEPEQAEQEPFDMEDHPPHRLCECRKCMEYFTPLPDCDAFAASGKPIAKQTNTQFMEGYRIGLAEMREACAKVCAGLITPWDENTPNGELIALRNDGMRQCAAAIRAINFEGDTGFRPVSEMIAEHKQDPKKAAAIEKAKMRKAEQKSVAERKAQVNELIKESARLIGSIKDEGAQYLTAIDALRNAYRIGLKDSPVDAKAIRSEALEEAAKVCEQGTGDAIQTETLKLLLQERGRITSVIRRLK